MKFKSTVKRRYVTLIEMMIVMFLIALITGVVAYNYRGSLDEGKAFKTKAAIEKIETILNLEIARNPDAKDGISSGWQEVIARSPLVHDRSALLKDGWGTEFTVDVDDNGNVHVTSQKFEEYKRTHQSLFSE